MSGTMEVIIRTFTAFILLWFFVQVLGKQTISQRTYHLYIASITVGTIAGNLTFNIKIKFLYFVLALLIMSMIVFTLNKITLKSRLYRKWISGEPSILIEKGQILEERMRKLGYSFDSLRQALREKDIFDIEEVENAILETNGSLSVLKKPAYRNVTKQDLPNSSPSFNKSPVELIIGGELVERNISQKGENKDRLFNELRKRGLERSEVCYAVVGTDGHLYFVLYRDQN